LHSGRPFYQSGVRSDYTSNVVGRSGLSSSEYAGDRRITKASTRPLQPVREEGRWPTPRDFLTLIDRLKRSFSWHEMVKKLSWIQSVQLLHQFMVEFFFA
jgi:hypothetical protein